MKPATPEQRIASRLLASRGLSPPIDVARLAAEFADIEYDTIPTGADAILLYPSRKRHRPLIILDRGRSPVRERFTLAHELGHIAIPWHVGELAYTKEWSGKFGDYSTRLMEAEANRFAAELLMPTAWVRLTMQSCESITDTFRKLRRTANVSAAAACLALNRCLPRGFVFAQVDRSTKAVVMSGKSEGTLAVPPGEQKVLSAGTYDNVEHVHDQVQQGGRIFHWWRFGKTSVIPEPVVSLSSRELLEKIYADSGIVGDRRLKIDRRLNGIIGHAYSKRRDLSWKQRYAILGEALAGRGPDIPIASHPEFDVFLALRARELAERARQ